LDILPDDLALAPTGAYDDTISGDVATVEIPGPFDLVFSRAVLEHVEDPGRALANLARALTPGGLMAHYLPCRNAPFAVMNRLLGNTRARQLLLAIYPEKVEHSGFLAHYRDCTPAGMRTLCRSAGVEDVTLTPYYHSKYAAFFVPLYTADLLRQALSCACGWDWWSEGFAIVARRPEIH
ncbi:MAG TPA: methyltransferase domain-containing protein, partial [Gemmatimonadales bacterium]|nr:methyltransferase domain-containing protein [Gemmatimonadales bacterium]